MAHLYTIPNATEGMDSILVQTITQVPALTPLLLLFVYFVVTLGGISAQKARSSTSDYAIWGVTGALATLMVALIMSVTAGLIRLDWLVLVVVLTIFNGIWFFFDRKQREI